MKLILQDYAKSRGESLNGFVKRAVEEAMGQDPPLAGVKDDDGRQSREDGGTEWAPR
jgi:hypothetical protein